MLRIQAVSVPFSLVIGPVSEDRQARRRSRTCTKTLNDRAHLVQSELLAKRRHLNSVSFVDRRTTALSPATTTVPWDVGRKCTSFLLHFQGCDYLIYDWQSVSGLGE